MQITNESAGGSFEGIAEYEHKHSSGLKRLSNLVFAHWV